MDRRIIILLIALASVVVLFFVGNHFFHFLPHQGDPANIEQHDHSNESVTYYCPMHPNYTSDKPGQCPICNMDLVLKKEGAENVEGSSNPTIFIPSDKQALVGIVSTTVRYQDVSKTVRTVGVVANDPDLYLAQEQYLQALSSYRQASETLKPTMQVLLNSARKKLLLLGMKSGHISSLEREGKPWSGLYAGTESGSVWIDVTVYENDIRFLKEGQTVIAESPSWRGERFSGKLILLPDVLDTSSRSLKAKARIQDPEKRMRSGMVLDVLIENELGKRLVVPEDAVLLTGERSVVFVADENDHFTVRDIRIGVLADGFYEVKSGLKEGERVVSSGAFFLDSEARLKSSYTGEGTGEHAH